eukprot:gnl/MRDRNA2_/MRDRNA2_50156_c0_seq2.p1 gnl/MRDRNA2_/MRDRNA2_50156_c0~~gnl/MRDRNA2_/MRDRNA2_50156_c0_seq2.p1  ORF type:complete len:425 (-),score=75.47 gnl/MRDRNA2_/MRDRNA2_50156_c0_seq2:71-1279(-)
MAHANAQGREKQEEMPKQTNSLRNKRQSLANFRSSHRSSLVRRSCGSEFATSVNHLSTIPIAASGCGSEVSEGPRATANRPGDANPTKKVSVEGGVEEVEVEVFERFNSQPVRSTSSIPDEVDAQTRKFDSIAPQQSTSAVTHNTGSNAAVEDGTPEERLSTLKQNRTVRKLRPAVSFDGVESFSCSMESFQGGESSDIFTSFEPCTSSQCGDERSMDESLSKGSPSFKCCPAASEHIQNLTSKVSINTEMLRRIDEFQRCVRIILDEVKEHLRTNIEDGAKSGITGQGVQLDCIKSKAATSVIGFEQMDGSPRQDMSYSSQKFRQTMQRSVSQDQSSWKDHVLESAIALEDSIRRSNDKLLRLERSSPRDRVSPRDRGSRSSDRYPSVPSSLSLSSTLQSI